MPFPVAKVASHLRKITLCLFAAGALLWTKGRASDVPETISSPADLHAVSTLDRTQSHPLKLPMTVRYYDAESQLLWAEAGGTSFKLTTGSRPLPILPGKTYLFEGNYIPAEGILAENVSVTPYTQEDVPAPVEVAGLTDPQTFDRRFVTLEGRVHGAKRNGAHHWFLDVVVDNKLVNCVLRTNLAALPTATKDSVVRLTGVFEYERDPRGWCDTTRLWIDDTNQIEATGRTAEDSRFSLPATPIDQLPQCKESAPVRVTGVVQRYASQQSLFLRDETGQVELKTSQSLAASAGDTIDAVGYPSAHGTQWMLREGLFQKASASTVRDAQVFGKRLRLVERILELPRREVEQGAAVLLRGVVLWSAPGQDFFILKDATGGVCVQLGAWQGQRPAIGSEVVVEGATKIGTYSPAVRLSRLDVVGSASLPDPKIVTLEHALTGVEENRWVEMTGYLRDITTEGGSTKLTLVASAGEFTARLPADAKVQSLQGSVVRIQGVCTATSNEDHQLTGIDLLVSGAPFVQVEEPAPVEPFSVPMRTIASLHQYNTIEAASHRVRLSGVVLHHVVGRYIMIQDESDGLLVLSRSKEPLSPGNFIEVVGFPGRESSRVVLREAIYRTISKGKEPSPLRLMNPEAVNDALDIHLVNITGTLLDKSVAENRTALMMQTRDRVFEAVIEKKVRPEMSDEWQPGSQLRITGVYQVKLDEYRQPYAYQLLLRSPLDVAVVSRPSWWTTERLLIATALTCGCILLAVAWAEALRKRVKKQTVQIRTQLEKEAHLEARYREIFESASDFIFTVDLKGHFTSFNRSGEKMTGYPREDALKLNFRDLLHPDDAAQALPFLEPKPGDASTVTFQSRFRTQSGGITWAETSIQPIYKSGKLVGMLGVARDINERKQIEETLRQARDAAEATTRAKSAFLANMSHEIRTPMNGVIGMSNLLLDTSLNRDQRDLAETVKQSAESLLTILNDILDFSKIEAGRMQFDTLDFDLREMVDGTLDLLAAKARDKKLAFGALIPHDLPCLVRGDPGRLRQVLLNLLSNALKFTEKGEVFLSVSLQEETEGGVRLLFRVNDTGIGLSKEVADRLFKPFSQADETTTRRYGGTGLGLAISKQIVELMDGHIGVESTSGEGSSFWFTVLLAKQPGSHEQNHTDTLSKLRDVPVTVIDHDPTNSKILQHYLTALQMDVHFAPSRDFALEALQQSMAKTGGNHVVIVNHYLPEMSGMELARQLHAMPFGSQIRTVLLISLEQQFPKEELREAGITCTLSKPIRQSELQYALLKAMQLVQPSNPQHFTMPDIDLPNQGPKLRILIAEDNVVNQRVTTRQLMKLGHKVEVAGNGLEVLTALDNNHFDVVLMDCQMPELDGYETTRRIRRHPKHSTQWVIAMTANAMIGDRETCLEAGMNDYITKPTRIQDLSAALLRSKPSQTASAVSEASQA
jgi:PAS domain S-box-containing protein